MVQQTPVAFAEIFPLKSEVLPRLIAYRLDLRGSNLDYVGRRLADRLGRLFPGHWVWTQNLLVTEHHELKPFVNEAVRDLRIDESETFQDLARIIYLRGYRPDVQAQADFAAAGLFSDLNEEIRSVLATMTYALDGKATVEHDYDVRGWVIGGEPALSISVNSRLIFNQDLRSYAVQHSSVEELIGLQVADKVPSQNGSVYKGEIVNVVGKLDVDVPRDYLLNIAKKDGSRALIREAPEGETVVRVGYNQYDYVVGALRIVLDSQHYRRFGIHPQNAQNATWITPSHRTAIIQKIASIAKSHGLIGDAYSSEQSRLFFLPKSYHYDPTLLLADGRTVEYHNHKLLQHLTKSGLYCRVPELGTANAPLRLGIIKLSSTPIDKFQGLLEEKLNGLGFVVDSVEVVSIPSVSRAKLGQAIDLIRLHQPHVLIGMLPGVDSKFERDWAPYYEFKSLTLDKLPTLVVDMNTGGKTLDYIVDNAVLGLVSQLGNVPYVLANPLDYADAVVGLGMTKQRSARDDAQSGAVFAHISGRDGRFIGCRVVGTPPESEAIPSDALPGLLPFDDFNGKTVVIHRDEAFRGDEKAKLREYAQQINASFFLVEIMKGGSPRLYVKAGNSIGAPKLGTAFVTSDTEGFLVASWSSTTPNPLHIRTEAPFTIGKALHSVFTLTLMNYSSLRRPKLPVSLHFGDKIGYLASRGVKPQSGHTSEMYWL